VKEAAAKMDEGLVKSHIQSLFWKESHRTSNLIRNCSVDLGSIFRQDRRLRFLMPVRNPMDCAISNLSTGHVQHFPKLPEDPSVEQVTHGVLEEILWFAELKEQFPDRFFHYFEHEISPAMLADMARFLSLQPLESWLTSAMAVMKINPSYDHEPALVESYRRFVSQRFSRFPAFEQALLQFA
jgi:hypothetical protein